MVKDYETGEGLSREELLSGIRRKLNEASRVHSDAEELHGPDSPEERSTLEAATDLEVELEVLESSLETDGLTDYAP